MTPPPPASPIALPPAYDDTVVDVPHVGACRRADVYDVWRFAQEEVDAAFRAWVAAPERARHMAHVVYRAALDREERAAAVLAAALRAPVLA
jgi:hypothetical protein